MIGLCFSILVKIHKMVSADLQMSLARFLPVLLKIFVHMVFSLCSFNKGKVYVLVRQLFPVNITLIGRNIYTLYVISAVSHTVNRKEKDHCHQYRCGCTGNDDQALFAQKCLFKFFHITATPLNSALQYIDSFLILAGKSPAGTLPVTVMAVFVVVIVIVLMLVTVKNRNTKAQQHNAPHPCW